jgi:hypothetical protein
VLILATFVRLTVAKMASGSIYDWRWPLLAALLAGIAGLLFDFGVSPREFWPLAALCVALGTAGVSSISQAVTFTGVLEKVFGFEKSVPGPGV